MARLCRLIRAVAGQFLPGLVLACILWTGLVQAQSPETAPLPPIRPFDMDMPAARPRIVTPPIVTAPPAAASPGGSGNGAEGVPQIAPEPPHRPASLPARKDEPAEADAGGTPAAPAPAAPAPPEPAQPAAPAPSFWSWPRLTPQQQDKAETDIVEDTPTGPGITTDPGTSIACLPQRLKTVLNKVVAKYGSLRVTSTYRPAWRARRGSYHRRCEAVDFRVPGHRPGEVLALVKTFPETGGRKVYWNGLIHVDTGPDRPW